ncbi:17430_t:CDS:2 [Funneliformis caledonium]|uniref:17430_t:CDS:1 n=1 Tax=Funneliformis caledonium TaxID=1117310 RepID=A0A9N9CGG3_9GLOM|nr:17430_t:CDS:2 [Funneliformis caledonium]
MVSSWERRDESDFIYRLVGKDSAKSECLAGLKPNAIMRQGLSLRTIKTINHDKTLKDSIEILLYLKSNPIWISAFANGEGCFTASLMCYLKGMWGLQPQGEFHITQKVEDLPLLEAINAYFDNKGGVYVKPNEMAVVTFKSIPILEELIIPFFLKYPLLSFFQLQRVVWKKSAKSYEFEKWCEIVQLLRSHNHIGKTLAARDAFLDIAKLCIKEWLESLTGVPSIEAKVALGQAEESETCPMLDNQLSRSRMAREALETSTWSKYLRINNGNQQERLVDNSNFNSEAKSYFLGGFAEGEGSVSASVKVHSDFGVHVQPEFGVTQHENGKHILAGFKDLFDGKGNLHLKPGSQDVLEYKLLGLTNLIDHVVPFYLKYVRPFSGKVKEFNTFLEILERKQRKEHFTQEGLIDMVKLAYTLNEEGGTCYYPGQKGILCQSQQLESSEAIRRAGEFLERNNGPFLEDMVQPSTRVAGIKPKVAKFCPGVELHTLANHYMLGRLKPCGTQPIR